MFLGINSPDEKVSFQTAKNQTHYYVKNDFTQIMMRYAIERNYLGVTHYDWIDARKDNVYLFNYLYNTYFNTTPKLVENYDRLAFREHLKNLSPSDFDAYCAQKISNCCSTTSADTSTCVSGQTVPLTVRQICRDVETISSNYDDEFSLEMCDSHEDTVETWAETACPPVIIYAPPNSGKTTTISELRKVTNTKISDTDAILTWTSPPSVVFTNIPTILKHGVTSYAVLPSREEFFARCIDRQLSPEKRWYDDAHYFCVKHAYHAFTNDYVALYRPMYFSPSLA